MKLLLALALLAPSAAAAARPAEGPPAELRRKAESGDAEAQDRLGMWHDDRGDGKTALEWYRKAAAQGHANGLHHVGVMLEGGREGKGAPRDCESSRRSLLQAAAAGNEASAFRIGYQYYRGVCAERDDKKAAEWFERSGTPMGLFYVGLMRESGRGAPADPRAAAALYERAYAGGVVRAANQLAHIHFDFAPRDAEKAYLWYLRGAAEADSEDRARLALLRRELPREARERAEREAKRP